MAQETIKKSNKKGLHPKEEPGNGTLWKQHGMEDVYFQRDAQITFWTVLGGIAVAALLTQITNLIDGIQMGRWYLLLYFLTSIMLITNSWVTNLWGSLVLRMQVNILYALIQLMNLVCLAILCLQVTNPLTFFVAGGFFVLFGLFMDAYLMKSGAWVGFTPEKIKGIKFNSRVYLAFVVLCFGAAANLFWYPSVAADVGWGVLTLFASIAAMVMQHFTMKQERKELGIP